MKIALLVPEMDLGGVEQGTFDLACGFKKIGHKVLVISGQGQYIPRLQENGVKWYPVPMARKTLPCFCRALRRIRKIISEEKPDILHCRSRFPAWVTYFASKPFPGSFLVTSIHGFHHNRWYSRIMAKGKRVIVVSEGLKDYAIKFLGAEKEKIRVVYNGFDFTPFLTPSPPPAPSADRPASLEDREPAPATGNQSEKDEITVGAVGRLSKAKGYRYLIEALYFLQESFPNLKAVIVGEGPEEKQLKTLTQKLLLEKKVSFVTGKSVDYLPSFDVLTAPHLSPEPKPINGPHWPGRTAAEAQVAGIPVVTTLQGIAPGTFESGTAEIFAPAKDPQGLAEGIKYLLTHPEEKQALVERAKKSALENFSMERMITKTLEVYQEIVE